MTRVEGDDRDEWRALNGAAVAATLDDTADQARAAALHRAVAAERGLLDGARIATGRTP